MEHAELGDEPLDSEPNIDSAEPVADAHALRAADEPKPEEQDMFSIDEVLGDDVAVDAPLTERSTASDSLPPIAGTPVVAADQDMFSIDDVLDDAPVVPLDTQQPQAFEPAAEPAPLPTPAADQDMFSIDDVLDSAPVVPADIQQPQAFEPAAEPAPLSTPAADQDMFSIDDVLDDAPVAPLDVQQPPVFEPVTEPAPLPTPAADEDMFSIDDVLDPGVAMPPAIDQPTAFEPTAGPAPLPTPPPAQQPIAEPTASTGGQYPDDLFGAPEVEPAIVAESDQPADNPFAASPPIEASVPDEPVAEQSTAVVNPFAVGSDDVVPEAEPGLVNPFAVSHDPGEPVEVVNPFEVQQQAAPDATEFTQPATTADQASIGEEPVAGQLADEAPAVEVVNPFAVIDTPQTNPEPADLIDQTAETMTPIGDQQEQSDSLATEIPQVMSEPLMPAADDAVVQVDGSSFTSTADQGAEAIQPVNPYAVPSAIEDATEPDPAPTEPEPAQHEEPSVYEPVVESEPEPQSAPRVDSIAPPGMEDRSIAALVTAGNGKSKQGLSSKTKSSGNRRKIRFGKQKVENQPSGEAQPEGVQADAVQPESVDPGSAQPEAVQPQAVPTASATKSFFGIKYGKSTKAKAQVESPAAVAAEPAPQAKTKSFFGIKYGKSTKVKAQVESPPAAAAEPAQQAKAKSFFGIKYGKQSKPVDTAQTPTVGSAPLPTPVTEQPAIEVMPVEQPAAQQVEDEPLIATSAQPSQQVIEQAAVWPPPTARQHQPRQALEFPAPLNGPNKKRSRKRSAVGRKSFFGIKYGKGVGAQAPPVLQAEPAPTQQAKAKSFFGIKYGKTTKAKQTPPVAAKSKTPKPAKTKSFFGIKYGKPANIVEPTEPPAEIAAFVEEIAPAVPTAPIPQQSDAVIPASSLPQSFPQPVTPSQPSFELSEAPERPRTAASAQQHAVAVAEPAVAPPVQFEDVAAQTAIPAAATGFDQLSAITAPQAVAVAVPVPNSAETAQADVAPRASTASLAKAFALDACLIWLGAWALMQFAGTKVLVALLAAAVVYLPLGLIAMAGRTLGMSFLHLKVTRIDSKPLSTGDKLTGVLTRKTRIVNSE